MKLPSLTRAALASCAALAAAATVAAAPAYADTRPTTPAGTQAALVAQFGTLSGALLNAYAQQSGQTLSQYLAGQQLLLNTPSLTSAGTDTGATAPDLPTPAPAAGSATATVPSLPALGTADALGSAAAMAKPITATTLTQLNAQLAGAGLTVDTRAYNSLNALAAGVLAKSNTLDGAVTLAGAKWMSQLSGLRMPALAAPKVATAAMPATPKDALVFGLFADKSLTAMVNANPGLFTAASKSGLGSKALADSWNKSMLSVYQSSQADFTKVLPDPCTGGMLAVMATGNPASAGKFGGSCSPACVTGGLYLNSQTTGMFAPGTASTFSNPYSSLWNSTTLNGMQRWQQEQLLEQNPQLAQQIVNDSHPQASAACNASSTAAGNALGATLPGIFGQLRTK